MSEIGNRLVELARHLETVARINGSGATEPGTKASVLRDRDHALANQIGVAATFEGAPEIKRLLHQLRIDHLDLRNPVFGAYWQRIVKEYAPELQAMAAGGVPNRRLSDPQFQVLLILAGDRICEEEAFALRMLEPIMSPAQKRDVYLPYRQASHDVEEGVGLGLIESIKDSFKVTSPYAPMFGITAGIAADLIAGPWVSTASVIAAGVGQEGSDYLSREIRKAGREFGIERFENPEFTNALLLLLGRAERSETFEGPTGIAQRAMTEAALVRELLKLHKQPEEPSKKEQVIVSAFERYASALEKIATKTEGDQKPEVEATRNALLKSVRRSDLEQIAAGIHPDRVLNPEEMMNAADVLARNIVHSMALLTKPPLLRLVMALESSGGVDGVLAARDRSDRDARAPRLPEADLDALRALAGNEPSLPEVLLLSRLIATGALEPADLWGPEAKVKLPDGEAVDAKSVAEAMSGMRDAASGATMKTIGQYAPWIGRILAVGGFAACMFSGAWLPLAFAALIAPRLVGNYAGRTLQAKGSEQTVMENTDISAGRPVLNEQQMLIDRYADLSAFSTGDGLLLRPTLKREANAIRRILTAAAEAPGAATGSEQHAATAPLRTFATELEALAALPDSSEAKLKMGLKAAQAKLLGPDLAKAMRMEVLLEKPLINVRSEPFSMYVSSKMQLLTEAEAHLARERAQEGFLLETLVD